MSKNFNDNQVLPLALEYYNLGTLSELSIAELERVEEILEISESNSLLDILITAIDIDLEENINSPKKAEQYCNETREKIKISMKEYLNNESLIPIAFTIRNRLNDKLAYP